MRDFWLKVDKTKRHCGQNAQFAMRSLWWGMRHLPVRCPIFIIGCNRAVTALVYKTFSESKKPGILQRETHDFWMIMHPLANKDRDTHELDAQDATLHEMNAVTCHFHTYIGNTRYVGKHNAMGYAP